MTETNSGSFKEVINLGNGTDNGSVSSSIILSSDIFIIWVNIIDNRIKIERLGNEFPCISEDISKNEALALLSGKAFFSYNYFWTILIKFDFEGWHKVSLAKELLNLLPDEKDVFELS